MGRMVLMKISSVFRDLLEGDETTTELELTDATDNVMKCLEHLIYSEPIHRQTKNKHIHTSEDYKSSFTLINKYDLEIMKTYMTNKLESGNWFKNGRTFHDIFDDGNKKNCSFLVKLLKRNCIDNVKDIGLKDLKEFKPSMVNAMLEQIS